MPYTITSSGDSVFYISLHSALIKGFKIKVTEFSAEQGTPVGQPLLLSSDNEVTSEESILYVGANAGISSLIWTDKAFKSLKVNVLGTKHITHVNVPSGDGKSAENITVHGPSSRAAKAHLLVHYQGRDANWAEVFHSSSQTIGKAYDLPCIEGKSAFSASSQGSDVYFTRHTASRSILFSSENSTVLNQWNVRRKAPGGLVEGQEVTHAISEVISRGGSTHAVRSALALASGDWELVRNGECVWSRLEGLAGTIAATFVEVTKEESLEEELATEGQSDPLTAYVHRVKRHARDLQHLPGWTKILWKRTMGSIASGRSHFQDLSARRDSFGFRKLVIVATENGRLAALDVGNLGNIVWSIQAVTLQTNQRWNMLNIQAEGGAVLVRGEGGEFLRVTSNTGTILEYQTGGITSSLKTNVPVMDAFGDKILVPINRDGSLGQMTCPNLSTRTIIVTQDEDSAVHGWMLSKNSKPRLSWSFAPTVGEHLTAISARPSHDPVASIGKALGDRNVLYKYLNSNELLITAIEDSTSTVNFYVLDSTSGATIYSTKHTGVDVSKPIVSVVSENWFAYSLFSESSALTQGATQLAREKLKGYQLVISELYESPFPNDRGSLGSLSNSSSIHPLADEIGDILEMPHVISQTFLIPGPISSMSVTSTLQGITTRSLLCTIPDLNSIISISRAFVDPRRPVGRDPTTAEAEEGLFRYSPVLDFEPKWIISHKRDVMSVSSTITSPSLLESTSLVFAFGEIDLFGTRTAPIGAFDLLGKGFSKLQLVLTVVALAIGTTIVAPFVSSS